MPSIEGAEHEVPRQLFVFIVELSNSRFITYSTRTVHAMTEQNVVYLSGGSSYREKSATSAGN